MYGNSQISEYPILGQGRRCRRRGQIVRSSFNTRPLAAPQRTAVECREQLAILFNHLVGAAEERDRERKAERLRGLEIDDQLDPC
jgi:hypothetical protein